MTRRTRRLAPGALILALVSWLIPATVHGTTSFCDVPHEERPPVLPEPVEACGTVALSGDQPGYVRMMLPRSVTIQNPRITGLSDFSLSGAGGFVGFALVEDAPGLMGKAWLGGRLPASAASTLFFMSLGTIGEEDEAIYEIPAGNYRLFLLPGTGAAELTLHLDGLTGDATSQVRHGVRYDLRFPEEHPTTSLIPHLYAVGGGGELQGQGVLFQAAWFTADTRLATVADGCFFDGAPPDPLAYLPGCTAISIASMGNLPPSSHSSEGTIDPGPDTTPELKLLSADWSPADHGDPNPGLHEWGQTISIEAAVSPLPAIYSLMLWLSFE